MWHQYLDSLLSQCVSNLFLNRPCRDVDNNLPYIAQDVRLNFPSAEVLHNDAPQQGYILVRLHRPEEHVQLARSSVAKSFSVLISQLDTFVQIVGAASQVS
jgi:hypothetical protein